MSCRIRTPSCRKNHLNGLAPACHIYSVPDYAKDVVLGVLGASVALAGLLLVFCGFVFGQAASFPPATTDDSKIERYKRAGALGLWPFLGSIVNSVAVVIWLIWPGCRLYFGILGFFIVLLAATAVYGTVVIQRYL